MSDVWEEGYSLKELSKRSAVLLERKEELETRRKRTQTLKRAAARKSAAAASLSSPTGIGAEGDAEAGGQVLSSSSLPSGSLGALGLAAAAAGTGGSGAAASSSGAGGSDRDRDRDNLDGDLDLNTEIEVIKVHMEQLKRLAKLTFDTCFVSVLCTGSFF
jgi:hypothetical protein